jgi:phosphoglycerol transferase MdoB-like AlkP superfamily enzyme
LALSTCQVFAGFAQSFGILMACYLMARIVFVVNNPPTEPNALSWGDWFTLWLQGLRFDASAIVLLNVPFLAVFMLAHVWVRTRAALGREIASGSGPNWSGSLVFWFFVCTNAMAIFINVADAYYFSFSGRRSTLATLAVRQDIVHQVPQLLVNFWQVSLLSAVAIGAFVFFELRRRREHGIRLGPPHPEPVATRGPKQTTLLIASWLILAATVVFVARGGWQRKPLGVASAYALVDPEHAPLVLNTTFTALKASMNTGLPSEPLFAGTESELKVWQTHRLARASSELHGRYKDHNIVFVILESFGREYLGDPTRQRPCYMPYVCGLREHALAPDPAYANGRTSIESFYSVHAGIPSLLGQALVTSAFGTVAVPGLASRLSDVGYNTAFFHGGKNGTMFFDAMARQVGFEKYFGLNEFLKEGGRRDQLDGVWGVFDEPFLHYTLQKMDNLAEPFFTSVFTLSSHNPYIIPSDRKGRYPKGTLPIHESLGYTDEAFRSFMELAQTKPWYERTIFVVTADHTSVSDDKTFQTLTGAYRVPILVMAPGARDRRDHDLRNQVAASTPAQHVDIAPTIIDALGLEPSMESFFGTSLLKKDHRRTILGRSGELLWATDGESTIRFPLAQLNATTIVQSKQPSMLARLDHDARALFQSYFNGLARGRWPINPAESTP